MSLAHLFIYLFGTLNKQNLKAQVSKALDLTNKEVSISGSIPGGGLHRRRDTSGNVPLRAEMTSYRQS